MTNPTPQPLSTTHEVIGPAEAAKYLKQNLHNRRLREWHVKRLADDMSAGRWQENGEAGIDIDWNGNVADGQHTLAAIEMSGATITLRVTRGVDPASRVAHNSGLRQRLSDDLSVAGVRYATFSEPLLRKIIWWQRVAAANKGAGGLSGYRRLGRASRAELAAEWPLYAEQIQDTLDNTTAWYSTWPGNRGVLHFGYWLLAHSSRSNVTTVTDFFDRIRFGSSEEDDRMMFARLRDKFTENEDAAFQTFFLVQAWNSWCKHERRTKFQLPAGSEVRNPFPRVYRAR